MVEVVAAGEVAVAWCERFVARGDGCGEYRGDMRGDVGGLPVALGEERYGESRVEATPVLEDTNESCNWRCDNLGDTSGLPTGVAKLGRGNRAAD